MTLLGHTFTHDLKDSFHSISGGLGSLTAADVLPFIIMLPLAGAIFNGFAGRKESKKTVATVAVGSVAGAFFLAIIAFARLLSNRMGGGDEPSALVCDLYEWFTVVLGNDITAPVHVRFAMDALSGVMTLVITGIGLLIHIYSVGYMSDEPSYARFFAYLNLFTASMLILVLGSNFPLLFVGWEGVGLCSYLLIGFWWDNPDYAAAGRKAFVVNRIGDFGVLMGMFFLLAAAHTFEFGEINQHAPSLGSSTVQLGFESAHVSVSLTTLACLFLFLGCAGKSAQLPLYVWLPDAMAGPTPVSALIHAATMVTAGVYLICRLSPVFVTSPVAMAVIAIVGTATALLGASIALVQNQIKKILAYSTVSQLGFMFAGVGVGAFAAGFFHVFTHAFFKACLFLGAGSVMHAVSAHGDADVRELGGLRRYLPKTHWTFLVSCIAIAGLPLFSGFFSKDEILLGAASASHYFEFAPWLGPAICAALVVAATMTAFYMFRLYFLTFSGDYRGATRASTDTVAADDAHEHASGHGHDSHDDHAHHGHAPHESPSTMTIPLAVLGVGAIFAGYLGLPHAFHLPNLWTEWLSPVLASVEAHGEGSEGIALMVMAAGTAAAVIGSAASWMAYGKGQRVPGPEYEGGAKALHQFLMDKWRVDELYGLIVVRPLKRASELSANLDRVLVDGVLTRLTSAIVRLVGFLVTRLQTGVMYVYTAVLIVGMAVLGWWFVFPHPQLHAEPKGTEVRYAVGTGLGYEYRWDFDSNGSYDTEWERGPNEVVHPYAESEYHGAVLTLSDVLAAGPSHEIKLEPNVSSVLAPSLLAADWSERTGSTPTPPAVRFKDGHVVVRVNDAHALQNGGHVKGPEVELGFGDRIQFGSTELRVSGWVRGTVEVRNAFGNTSATSVDVTVPSAEVRAATRMNADLGSAR